MDQPNLAALREVYESMRALASEHAHARYELADIGWHYAYHDELSRLVSDHVQALVLPDRETSAFWDRALSYARNTGD